MIQESQEQLDFLVGVQRWASVLRPAEQDAGGAPKNQQSLGYRREPAALAIARIGLNQRMSSALWRRERTLSLIDLKPIPRLILGQFWR